MNKYSPIKSIRIKNFRNLGDVTLDFDESPIITLVGENEAGKTSVVKAIGVCAAHQTPRSQKEYIRDGTTGFGVNIELDDGTNVTRMKTATTNVYRVKYADGKVWEAQKLESVVPKAVNEAMGLLEEHETKELLQIRTYEDQLLFVITPASTNYKVMYDALKISQITKGIKAGSTEANELKAKVSVDEASINTLLSNLSNIVLVDMDVMLNIKSALQSGINVLENINRIIALKKNIETAKKQLGILNRLRDANISEISEVTVANMNKCGTLLNKLRSDKAEYKNIEIANNMQSISESLLSSFDMCYERKNELHELLNKKKKYDALGENVIALDISVIEKILRVSRLVGELKLEKSKLSKIQVSSMEILDDTKLKNLRDIDSVICLVQKISDGKSSVLQLNNYCDSVIKWMQSIGVATTSCPKCGESIIIDIDNAKAGG